MNDVVQRPVDINKVWDWYLALQQVHRCDTAINQYAELGLVGSPHDIEHHRMRNEAVQAALELEIEIWP